MTRTTARLARLTSALIAGTVVLAGCSEGGTGSDTRSDASAGSPAGQSAEFDDADVAFVQGMIQGMIPHHEGALQMARVAVDRASDPRVVDLAERIEAAQDPEIDLMTGWLQDWGRPLQEASGHQGGADHGSADMGGTDLESVPAGPEFDRLFLTSMIEHHKGAVEMARTEVEDGRNAEAVDLAKTIIETQTREIHEMERLLTELGG